VDTGCGVPPPPVHAAAVTAVTAMPSKVTQRRPGIMDRL
jgi:hypothetical protein